MRYLLPLIALAAACTDDGPTTRNAAPFETTKATAATWQVAETTSPYDYWAGDVVVTSAFERAAHYRSGTLHLTYTVEVQVDPNELQRDDTGEIFVGFEDFWYLAEEPIYRASDHTFDEDGYFTTTFSYDSVCDHWDCWFNFVGEVGTYQLIEADITVTVDAAGTFESRSEPVLDIWEWESRYDSTSYTWSY